MSRQVACFMMFALACTTGDPPRDAPPLLPDTWVAFERMAMFAQDNGQARLRGFDGAAPLGTTLHVDNAATGQEVARVTADQRGRFDAFFAAELDDTFEVRAEGSGQPQVSLKFRARDRLAALANVGEGRLVGTGSTPNQLVFPQDAPVAGPSAALVVLSGDNALDSVDADDGHRSFPLVPFSDVAGPLGPVPAVPWNVAARAGKAWVSRYGQGGVSAVSLASAQVTSEAAPDHEVVLPTLLHLDPAVDVNGDGAPESEVTALRPRNPTGVALADGWLLLTYSNVLSTSASGVAQYGPGMLLAYRLNASGEVTGEYREAITRFPNPQHVVVLPGNLVLVSCTGALQRDAGGWRVEGDSGLEVFDLAALSSQWTINLQGYGPSKPLLLDDGARAYVPSVLRAHLVEADLRAGTLTRGADAPIVLDETSALRSVFECVKHVTGLVFCPIFDSDQLVVVDAADGTVNPWPFQPLPLREPALQLKQGSQSIALRPGRNGVDRAGSDILILQSLSSRVVSLDTRYVLGP